LVKNPWFNPNILAQMLRPLLVTKLELGNQKMQDPKLELGNQKMQDPRCKINYSVSQSAEVQ
jgi:hypothetical protein